MGAYQGVQHSVVRVDFRVDVGRQLQAGPLRSGLLAELLEFSWRAAELTDWLACRSRCTRSPSASMSLLFSRSSDSGSISACCRPS